ncbi:uncharacterized protein LOC126744834 [Anthonomus grandis grandis]|uniref:uncharacterized protein LOC126744834 n=1 Tax=Anthonomus grandis grandis TaxID=2921223 RepID=UPI0021660699|nr:uncharacterized protein LOC126744834 [Anthonomus grandis grandis]
MSRGLRCLNLRIKSKEAVETLKLRLTNEEFSEGTTMFQKTLAVLPQTKADESKDAPDPMTILDNVNDNAFFEQNPELSFQPKPDREIIVNKLAGPEAMVHSQTNGDEPKNDPETIMTYTILENVIDSVISKQNPELSLQPKGDQEVIINEPLAGGAAETTDLDKDNIPIIIQPNGTVVSNEENI